MTDGQIIKVHTKEYVVDTGDKLVTARIRGIFRFLDEKPLVGDYVTIDEYNTIVKIHRRKNKIDRPSVANIDYAFIVMSITDPEFDFYLLDKLISQMEMNAIKPAIVVTKTDIERVSIVKKLFKDLTYYEDLGYPVFEGDSINELKTFLKGKTVVLAGQTGAGKSTLINRLAPHHKLKTGETSKKLGRGRHTTRHAEILEVYDGHLVDTPGFSSLNFHNIKGEDIRNSFIEFKDYNCKYQDCSHINTDGCALVKNLNNKMLKSRYENYQKILKESK